MRILKSVGLLKQRPILHVLSQLGQVCSFVSFITLPRYLQGSAAHSKRLQPDIWAADTVFVLEDTRLALFPGTNLLDGNMQKGMIW